MNIDGVEIPVLREDPDGPTEAQLYDDPETGPELDTMHTWLREQRASRWGEVSVNRGADVVGADDESRAEVLSVLGAYERQIIADVMTALAETADSTLVKNSTYRAMRRDGAAVERLNAWLQNHGMTEQVIQADGDAVKAATGMLAAAQQYLRAEADRLRRLIGAGRDEPPANSDTRTFGTG